MGTAPVASTLADYSNRRGPTQPVSAVKNRRHVHPTRVWLALRASAVLSSGSEPGRSHGYPNCVAAAKLVFDVVGEPTRAKLADGRDLLFFALPGHCPAPVPDRRPLPERATDQSQLRFDQSTGQWVIVAALRQDRTYKPPHQCPLCPGPTGLTSEVPAPDYDVVVFENRFPSLAGAIAPTPTPISLSAGDGFVSAPATAGAR